MSLSNSTLLTSIESVSTTYMLLDTLNTWQQPASYHGLKKFISHVTGTLCTPITCLIDAIFHACAFTIKLATGILVSPYNFVAFVFYPKAMAPADLEISSAFVHLGRLAESISLLPFLPFVSAISINASYLLTNGSLTGDFLQEVSKKHPSIFEGEDSLFDLDPLEGSEENVSGSNLSTSSTRLATQTTTASNTAANFKQESKRKSAHIANAMTQQAASFEDAIRDLGIDLDEVDETVDEKFLASVDLDKLLEEYEADQKKWNEKRKTQTSPLRFPKAEEVNALLNSPGLQVSAQESSSISGNPSSPITPSGTGATSLSPSLFETPKKLIVKEISTQSPQEGFDQNQLEDLKQRVGFLDQSLTPKSKAALEVSMKQKMRTSVQIQKTPKLNPTPQKILSSKEELSIETLKTAPFLSLTVLKTLNEYIEILENYISTPDLKYIQDAQEVDGIDDVLKSFPSVSVNSTEALDESEVLKKLRVAKLILTLLETGNEDFKIKRRNSTVDSTPTHSKAEVKPVSQKKQEILTDLQFNLPTQKILIQTFSLHIAKFVQSHTKELVKGYDYNAFEEEWKGFQTLASSDDFDEKHTSYPRFKLLSELVDAWKKECRGRLSSTPTSTPKKN